MTAKAIAHWVEDTFEVVLHRERHDRSASPPRLRLQEAEACARQSRSAPNRAFLAEYEKLKRDKGEDDPVYFMDAVHPQHNPVIACGWIKRGEDREVRSNTGRRRVNINGAIDLERLEPVVRFDDTINTDSTIALFEQLEQVNLAATWIYVICDNARYYRSKAVKEYLKTSRIKLVFLPPYAPNLNLIERYGNSSKRKSFTIDITNRSTNSERLVKNSSATRVSTIGNYARC